MSENGDSTVCFLFESNIVRAGVSHFLETHNGKARAFINEFLAPLIQLYSKGTRYCNGAASSRAYVIQRITNGRQKKKQERQEKGRKNVGNPGINRA